jgi:hypothetical protein
MGRKLSALLFGLIIPLALEIAPAQANDELDEFQITCDKELNYFSVRSLVLEDSKIMYDEQKVDAKIKDGFYPPGEIATHPYFCELDDKKISIEVLDHTSPDGSGECGTRGSYAATIKENGKDLFKFLPYGLDRCLAAETHVIEIVGNSALRDCILPDAGGQTECKYVEK